MSPKKICQESRTKPMVLKESAVATRMEHLSLAVSGQSVGSQLGLEVLVGEHAEHQLGRHL